MDEVMSNITDVASQSKSVVKEMKLALSTTSKCVHRKVTVNLGLKKWATNGLKRCEQIIRKGKGGDEPPYLSMPCTMGMRYTIGKIIMRRWANKTTVAVVEKTVIMAIDIAEAVRSGIASKDTLFQ